MRNLPDCPTCQESQLWLKRIDMTVQLRCYECGWYSGVITPMAGQDVSAAIAHAVWLERARQLDPGDEWPPFALLAALGYAPPEARGEEPPATDEGKE